MSCIVATRRAVARIPRTAPLSSNYRSNGASLGVDPTPASICRLALIQLPRRQLPRWYTCGRFIASTVIRVRRALLSFSTSLALPSVSPLLSAPRSLAFSFDTPSPFRVRAIVVPRSKPRCSASPCRFHGTRKISLFPGEYR